MLQKITVYNHVCHANRWLTLPVELLLRVLALLDKQELMTARLVCRDWRQASLTLMTNLNLNAWLERTSVGASTNSIEVLAGCLRVFPNLSSLELGISSPNELSLLSLAICSDTLKRLSANFFAFSMHCAGPVAVAMVPLARLRGLTYFNAHGPGQNSAPVHAQFISSSSMILAQCTGLCKVSLSNCGVEKWMLLLPLLAGLPHLRMLGELLLCDQEVVAGAASLTQLTYLKGTDNYVNRLHLQPLLALPALRALGLNVLEHGNWPALAHAAFQKTVRLAHLALQGMLPNDFLGSLGSRCLLKLLAGLTRLEMEEDHGGVALPHFLWQSCLGDLQYLRWVSADVARGGLAFPISLQLLELQIEIWESPQLPEVVQSMATLTGLTALSFTLGFPPYGWTTDGRANATWRTADFLKGLTCLVHLNLDHFLHVANVEDNVECLAALTGLRSLCLNGSCVCHGGYEIDDPQDWENSEWTWGACGLEAFEGRGGFLRLLPLTGVKVMDADGPWKVLKESSFASQVNAVWHVMGRPSLKFDDSLKHYGWPDA